MRAAGRDCREPSGKSAGPRTVAPSIFPCFLRLNNLGFIWCPSTVGTCCTYRVLKPSWQCALFGVCFHFVPRHALEQLIHIDGLATLYPMTGRVDLRVGLDGCDNSRCGGVNLASLLDNSFQGRANVPLPFCK